MPTSNDNVKVRLNIPVGDIARLQALHPDQSLTAIVRSLIKAEIQPSTSFDLNLRTK